MRRIKRTRTHAATQIPILVTCEGAGVSEEEALAWVRIALRDYYTFRHGYVDQKASKRFTKVSVSSTR